MLAWFFLQMFSDRNINEPIELAAKMQATVTKSPVYYYLFGYSGENKIAKMLFPDVPCEGLYILWLKFDIQLFFIKIISGVTHTEDAVFCYGYMAENEFSETDYKMWEAFQKMLHDYVCTG